jgi:ATPase subunit of ABC transporter with duplicated ATPase domains
MALRQAVLGMEDGAFFYGVRKVFAGITFLLDGERTALVGENGVGKSTLLKCLTGELELNRGKVIRSRNLRLGWLPQEVPPELGQLSVRQALKQSLRRIGAVDEDWRIDILLDEIEMSGEVADGPFGALSGGWQRLVLIAGAARLEEPDILILDEPTNHLDIGNIDVLERWLSADIVMPMLIVSHDREFLSRVSTRTLFLRDDGAHLFKVPFAQAREELLRRDAAAAVRRKLEEKEIKRLEAAAARYHVWGVKNPDFHKRQRATETRIAHMEAARTAVYQARERRLELADGELEAKTALRLADLTVKTPDGARTLIRIDRFALQAGDRVALLGENGAGKSTLLNVIAAAFDPKRIHYDGTAPVRFNPGARLVYFDQTMRELPLYESVLGYVLEAEGVTERDAIRALAQAGFAFARIREPIFTLSHGERARLTFLKLKLTKPNFYLLDEPTSHLDIEGQEDLESQLEEAEVACVFVSHDRWFTRSAATRFVEIRKGKLVEVESPDPFFAAQG